MNTKTRTKKFVTQKETYRAKIETIRRKEVRNLKKSFEQNRKGEH